jgi:DNA polymerase-3 subunit delta'
MSEGRPDNWGLIGHAGAVAFLARALARGRLAHAYLLVGPTGVGKRTLAQELARRILRTERLDLHPGYSHVERCEDPKTKKMRDQIAVAQVGELIGNLSRTSLLGGAKVAVIRGADRLGREAANALLKTLEEPAGETTLLLTADALDEVMPTVRSRCQTLRLSPVSVPQLEVALLERGLADAKLAAQVAALSGGRPGLARRLAADKTALDELLDWRELFLALPTQSVIGRWQALEAVLPKKLAFNESRGAARAFLRLASELLRDAALVTLGFGDRAAHRDALDGIGRFAAAVGWPDLAAWLEAVDTAHGRLDANVSARSVLEEFALFERTEPHAKIQESAQGLRPGQNSLGGGGAG